MCHIMHIGLYFCSSITYSDIVTYPVGKNMLEIEGLWDIFWNYLLFEVLFSC